MLKRLGKRCPGKPPLDPVHFRKHLLRAFVVSEAAWRQEGGEQPEEKQRSHLVRGVAPSWGSGVCFVLAKS